MVRQHLTSSYIMAGGGQTDPLYDATYFMDCPLRDDPFMNVSKACAARGEIG